jgi:hypothetical protein
MVNLLNLLPYPLCQVFKKKANEYVGNIREVFPDVEVQLNPSKPRKGAFNFSVQV